MNAPIFETHQELISSDCLLKLTQHCKEAIEDNHRVNGSGDNILDGWDSGHHIASTYLSDVEHLKKDAAGMQVIADNLDEWMEIKANKMSKEIFYTGWYSTKGFTNEGSTTYGTMEDFQILKSQTSGLNRVRLFIDDGHYDRKHPTLEVAKKCAEAMTEIQINAYHASGQSADIGTHNFTHFIK